MGLRVQLFGPFQLWRDDQLIQPETWRSEKAQALLKILLIDPGRTFTQDQLIDWLWPDADLDKAQQRLRTLVSQLRRILEPKLKRGTQSRYVLTRPSGYCFNCEADCVIDSEVCKKHLHQAHQLKSKDQFEPAIQEYEQAVALYQGEFLAEDRYADWAIPHTESWQRTYLDALSQLAECHARLAQYRRAIAHCNQILEIDPYREATYRQLMLYHYLVGDPERVVQVYERCRTRLRDDLDTEPLPETQQLYQQIVDRDIPGIDDVYQPVSVVERNPIPTLLKRVPFVSREQEYAELVTHLEQVKDGSGRMILVSGEAGIGKTRLIEELIHYGQHQHQTRTLEGLCHELSASLSYQPLIDAIRNELPKLTPEVLQFIQLLWLAEVADLVPELRDLIPDLPDNPSLPPELKRNRLFEGLAQFFTGLAQAERPLALFLDDLHWIDPPTLDFLAFFGPRLVNQPILIVGTYRSEEVEETHPLINLIEHGERQEILQHYELPRLSENAVDQLLSEITPQLDRSFRERIYQETQGNPFFIVAVLQNLFEEGLLQVREDGTWVSTVEEIPSEDRTLLFPEMAKGVIQRRLRRLKAEERQLLQLAAVIGDRFEVELLQQTRGGETPATLAALDGLTQAQLLVEVEQADDGDEGYAFSHNKIWEVVYYDEISGARRKLFHRQVGEALERVYANRLEEYSGRIAEHYYRGETWEKAVEYLLKAGEKAGRTYLNDEAIGYFQRVLERLERSRLGESRKEWQLEALIGLGEVYHGVGKEEAAEGHFREAIALGQEMGLAPRELVRLYHWLGEVLWWQSRYDEVIRIGEKGLALLGDDTESVEAALMNQTIATVHGIKKNMEKFREFTYRTAQFIQQLPYSAELRPAYIHIFGVYALDKNIEEAMKWLQALERKAEGHQDVRALGDVHHHAGDTLANRGDLHRAIARYQQALELFTKIGDTNHGNRSLIRMGEASLWLGDLEKAEEYAYRGLETAKTVGDKIMIAWAYEKVGTILLCQGTWKKAMEAFQKATQLYQETGSPYELWTLMSLGRTYLANRQRREALTKFQQAVALMTPDSSAFAYALSGLEEAYDDSEAFRAFCQHFQEEHPEFDDSPFVQWFLEPTEAIDFPQPQNRVHDKFVDSLSSDWAWQDPFDDSSFTVNDGLEIHAANGRDLGSITKWHINLSAPRILRPVSGDFSIQTVCVPVSKEKPAIGGLVLWKDRENYLRLARGIRGEHEISLEGCLGNEDVIIGHGRLAGEHVFLQLERLGDCVNALCSANGVDWFTVGHVTFPVDDPVEVGVYAIGTINRIIYPGAYPEGTAIRFESFQMWRT
ncbi:MAG: AAA family ATPase, partial [Candidatus Bipolaricaulia bacterium]